MSVEEVLSANQAFYAAFARRDFEAMDRVWAREAPCACIHPGWNVLTGRGPVMQSWKQIFESGGAPPIQPSHAGAYLLGEAAFVICLENVPGATLIATNVFVREDGLWMMVHHQAAPVARVNLPEEEDEDETEDESAGPKGGGMLN